MTFAATQPQSIAKQADCFTESDYGRYFLPGCAWDLLAELNHLAYAYQDSREEEYINVFQNNEGEIDISLSSGKPNSDIYLRWTGGTSRSNMIRLSESLIELIQLGLAPELTPIKCAQDLEKNLTPELALVALEEIENTAYFPGDVEKVELVGGYVIIHSWLEDEPIQISEIHFANAINRHLGIGPVTHDHYYKPARGLNQSEEQQPNRGSGRASA